MCDLLDNIEKPSLDRSSLTDISTFEVVFLMLRHTILTSSPPSTTVSVSVSGNSSMSGTAERERERERDVCVCVCVLM